MAKQALEGTRLNAFGMDPNDLTIVGLDTDDGPSNPLWDKRIDLPVDEALVRNIMVYGVQEPVLVRKNGDVPEVIDGRQRVRAAREANKRLEKAGSDIVRIPVMVRTGNDGHVFGVMVSTNEHRQDDGPIEKANKLSRYLDLGRSEDEACIAFGVSRATIRTWLAILNLDTSVQRAIDTGKVSPSAAAQLGSLPREEQKAQLDQLVAAGAKGTKAAAQRIMRAHRAPADENAATVAPAKRLVTKLLKANKKLEEPVMSAEFVRGVMWAFGDLSSARIAGLLDLEREVKAQ